MVFITYNDHARYIFTLMYGLNWINGFSKVNVFSLYFPSVKHHFCVT